MKMTLTHLSQCASPLHHVNQPTNHHLNEYGGQCDLFSQTRAETAGLGDPGLRSMREGDVIQLERRGFFRADKPYRGEGKPLVLFMIPDGKTQAMSTLASTLKHV